MSETGFVHLHVHSQYSLLEATCQTKALAKTAAESEHATGGGTMTNKRQHVRNDRILFQPAKTPA